ncbi:MAG TPA: HD domain-containing protein [Myxococcales bacterium]|jgi:hypothetical protein
MAPDPTPNAAPAPVPDPAAPAVDPTSPEALLGTEEQLGGSAAAREVNSWLRALSRAARAFALYDPGNEVVRTLVGDYRARAENLFKTQGAVKLEVRPFELAFAGDIVYCEKDRERSLAFRLFRDGVRGLEFGEKIGWDELLKLLEIVSVRYSGVRQQEDDLVTLLRKAAFKGLQIDAAEGFKPDEEVPESMEDPALAATTLLALEIPADFDLPLPALREFGAPAFRPLPPQSVAALVAEESPERVPAAAVRAAFEAFRLVRPPASMLRVQDALTFAFEIRDFLLVENCAGALLELGELLLSFFKAEPAVLTVHVRRFLDPLMLEAFAQGHPADEALPQTLVRLFQVEPARNFDLAITVFDRLYGGPSRPTAARVLAHVAKSDPEKLLARARTAEPALAGAYLEVLRTIDPARAIKAAVDLCPRADPAMQVQILRLLEGAPLTPETTTLAKELLGSPDATVRRQVVGLLAKLGGPRAFPVLHDHLEKRAQDGDLPPDEAEGLGRALTLLSAMTALGTFESWAKSGTKKLLGGFTDVPGGRTLKWAAVAGLACIEGQAAEAAIKLIMERGDEELRLFCGQTLARRKRSGVASAQRTEAAAVPAALGARAPGTEPPQGASPASSAIPILRAAPAQGAGGAGPARGSGAASTTAPTWGAGAAPGAAVARGAAPAAAPLSEYAVAELASAQARVGRAIARARVGEDRELAAEVRERGEHLVNLMSGLLRMSRIHAPDNHAFDQPVHDLAELLARLSELLGTIQLVTVGDQAYLNDVRIRLLDRGTNTHDMGSELKRHNVGGVTFFAPLPEEQLRFLLSSFAGPAPSREPRTALLRALRGKGIVSLELQGTYRFRMAGEIEVVQTTEASADLVDRAEAAVDEAFQNLGMGRLLNPLPLRRLVAEIVNGHLGAPRLFGVERPMRTMAAHAVRTAHIVLLVGRSLGLSEEMLQDLGLAALYHDVGYALRLPPPAPKVDLPRHAVAGARLMLRQCGFQPAKLRRFLGVGHHSGQGDSPGFFARLIHIAEDYDNLAHRAEKGSPARALASMLPLAGKGYDPLLLQATVNALGRFPPGTLVELDDGRVVVTVGLPRNPGTFEKPMARCLRLPKGVPAPSDMPLVDLARERPMVKVLQQLPQ